MARHRLIVGLDYGTTYSGVSFVTTDKADLEDINVIRDWPGKDGEWKTPSRIAYAFENRKSDLKQDLWGYQVAPGMIAYSWTKLLLDKDAKDTHFDDPNLQSAIEEGRMKLPDGRSAQSVASDFLACLYKHMEQRLLREFGKVTLDQTPMDCWLTVPAVWSDQAQNATKTAALEAGFASRPGDTISVITEPEAAAITVLKDSMRPESLNVPKIGDTVLVCDCGGGTVDITSYSIEQIQPKPMFEEICVGIGGKCGATSIDRSLEQLMSKRFGAAWDDIPIHRKGPGSNFMNRWETVKRQFGEEGDDRTQELGPINLKNIPDSQWYDEEEGMVKLTKNDVRSVFDPTITEVISLIAKQETMIAEAGKKLNRLVLVGGFGDSNYLYKKVKSWCDGKRVRAVCPQHPQSAIVRGAALRGLVGIAPRKKYCRRHYGFVVGMPFREGIDPESSSMVDPYNYTKLCTNRMLWLINKGDAITAETTRSHALTLSHRVKDADKRCTETLYSCADDEAPEHYNPYGSLESVGNVQIDFSSIGLAGLPHKREFGLFGSRYCEIPFEIQVQFGSKTGLLAVRALCAGEVMGSADIVFD